ncbi:MAG TPA: hypothetical protein VN939_23950, partial [Chthoniobacterales bacterium]|nr:hypothetical protein [Chthoniobacterales bacterium]
HRDKSFFGEFLDLGDVLKPGIVHQDIDSTLTFLEGRGGQLANRGGIAQVAGAKLCAYLTGQLCGGGIDIMKKHPSLKARKGLSNGPTNSASSSGDKDGFRAEIHF